MDTYSVSRLNSEIRAVIDGSFPLVQVEGEISNLARPRSGHLYFSLKDAHAQIRCAMFKNRRLLLRNLPENGDKVLVRARIGLYESRGDLQLIIESIRAAGEGDLQLAIEALKKKLSAEGLFDPQRKKPLPGLPNTIGIVSSPQGAAIRDILHVLQRRFPAIAIVLYPAAVQGDQAVTEIIRALDQAESRDEVDLLILARGGGSLEDLMAFNDEALARRIAAFPIPVISAIGHETDFSLIDLVADKRAPTPSAAAEIAAPDQLEIRQQLDNLRHRLQGTLRHRLRLAENSLHHYRKRLTRLHPQAKIRQRQQWLDELSRRLERSQQNRLSRLASRLRLASAQLDTLSPIQRLRRRSKQVAALGHRLDFAMRQQLQNKRARLGSRASQLHALSPLAVLGRGYSITRKLETDRPVHSSSELQTGDRISTRLASGSIISRVESRD